MNTALTWDRVRGAYLTLLAGCPTSDDDDAFDEALRSGRWAAELHDLATHMQPLRDAQHRNLLRDWYHSDQGREVLALVDQLGLHPADADALRGCIVFAVRVPLVLAWARPQHHHEVTDTPAGLLRWARSTVAAPGADIERYRHAWHELDLTPGLVEPWQPK